MTSSTRVVVAGAWAALRGQGCQAEQDQGERHEEAWGHPAGTGAAGAGIQMVLPEGSGQSGLHREWHGGAGRSGASRLHRSCFFHAFVHECEEFPHPAGAGLPREARGSLSCRMLLSGWESDPKDCSNPRRGEGSWSWCASWGTAGPRALSAEPGAG